MCESYINQLFTPLRYLSHPFLSALLPPDCAAHTQDGDKVAYAAFSIFSSCDKCEQMLDTQYPTSKETMFLGQQPKKWVKGVHVHLQGNSTGIAWVCSNG